MSRSRKVFIFKILCNSLDAVNEPTELLIYWLTWPTDLLFLHESFMYERIVRDFRITWHSQYNWVKSGWMKLYVYVHYTSLSAPLFKRSKSRRGGCYNYYGKIKVSVFVPVFIILHNFIISYKTCQTSYKSIGTVFCWCKRQSRACFHQPPPNYLLKR